MSSPQSFHSFASSSTLRLSVERFFSEDEGDLFLNIPAPSWAGQPCDRPHPPGTVEHVVLCSGRARLGPVGQCVELGAGDYISYAADVAHVLEAISEPVTAVMLIEHR